MLYYTGVGTGRQLKARTSASARALPVMAGYQFLKRSTPKNKRVESMNAMSLSELPTSVLELHTWPWWRRYWNRPPELVRKRCEAWCELLELREAAGKGVRLNTPKSKIFDDSRRRWSILDKLDRGNFTLRSRFPVSAWGAKEDFPKSTWIASASDDGASL